MVDAQPARLRVLMGKPYVLRQQALQGAGQVVLQPTGDQVEPPPVLQPLCGDRLLKVLELDARARCSFRALRLAALSARRCSLPTLSDSSVSCAILSD